MTRIIGIDLGTTNSCVALFDRGVPTVLASPEGERTTPSMVTFHPDGRVLVGAAARRHAVTQARRTVLGGKRLIGRKVNAPDIVRLARAVPFQLVAAPNGDAWVRLDEQHDVSPQEVAAYVLERMRTVAETAIGEPVTQAVITVPAYFNDVQRQATKDAGRIAGLDVRRILNEPTAAALAYGVHRKKTRQRLAVFDLGGGTFDISILHVENGVFEVLAVNGDAALGGDDFDRRVVERLVEELVAAGAEAPAADPVTLGRLKEEAERAKKTLSDEPEALIQLPYAARKASGEPLNLERTLTRHELEGLTGELIARLEGPCAAALRDAGLEASALDEVLLVGGMTRMPAVQSAVERFFGRRPSKGAHPDEVVAIGAATHAALLTSDRDDLVLLDVIPQSLGVRVGDTVSVVIPRNTTVPTRARKTFATTQDGQSAVTVEIYQGDARDLAGNRHLGRFTFEGLPPAPAGQVRVELTFAVDADGIVTLDAREPTSGRVAQHTLSPSGGLGREELERIIERRRAGKGP